MGKMDNMPPKNLLSFIRINLPKILLADGLDDALIGLTLRGGEIVALYSKRRVLGILKNRDGMSEDEASEYFSFNIRDAWLSDLTPVFWDGNSTILSIHAGWLQAPSHEPLPDPLTTTIGC